MRASLFALSLMTLSGALLMAQTQLQVNQEAGDSFKAADKKLNAVCQQLLQKYSKNPIFLRSLKSAQRAWIQFRDAQLAMKFPEREPGHYGSVLPMCKANYLAELTIERVKQLEAWLKPQEEGDVCSGTLGEFEAE